MLLAPEPDMPTNLPSIEDSGELLNSLEPVAGIGVTDLAAPPKAAKKKVNRTPLARERRKARDREYAGKRRAATKAAAAAAAVKFDSLKLEVAALQAENAVLRARLATFRHEGISQGNPSLVSGSPLPSL